MAYAAHQRRLAEPTDGHPYRVHLETAAARGSHEARAELAGPELPQAGAHVWEWFVELNAARGSGEFGSGAIGYAEIEAWARLTGRAPRPHEVMWLRALDRLWLAAPARKEAKRA